MAMRLRQDAGVLGEIGDRGMIVVVGVLARMREHEGRTNRAKHIDEAEQRALRQADRVVAEIPELDIRHPQCPRRCLGLRFSFRLHAIQRHAGLAPQFR